MSLIRLSEMCNFKKTINNLHLFSMKNKEKRSILKVSLKIKKMKNEEEFPFPEVREGKAKRKGVKELVKLLVDASPLAQSPNSNC